MLAVTAGNWIWRGCDAPNHRCHYVRRSYCKLGCRVRAAIKSEAYYVHTARARGRFSQLHSRQTGPITAEISIATQDIGFVNAGQSAEVKLETFAYTKYGTVDMVTADAVTDEKKGSYYPATLTLAKSDMLVDGKRVHISPGMNITAEIKTGQRRIIEYLLSAVQRAGSESLRER